MGARERSGQKAIRFDCDRVYDRRTDHKYKSDWHLDGYWFSHRYPIVVYILYRVAVRC